MVNHAKIRLTSVKDIVTFTQSPTTYRIMLQNRIQPLYFAYGSNLNKHDWNRGGFRPPFDAVFEKVANAWLPDHAPAFTYHSTVRNGGVLDIVERIGCCVPGALFRLKNQRGWESLCFKEGTPYGVTIKRVLSSDNQYVQAFTFTIRPEYFGGNFVAPSEEYVEVVRKGLRRHRLPTDILDAIADGEPAPAVNQFFCYGTLRRGDCRYSVMDALGILSERHGKVRGRLHNCGAYPAITLDAPQKAVVHGDFIQVCNLDEAFRRLDTIEGYRPNGNHNLYNRRLVPVRLDDRSVRIAWIYEYARPLPETVIASGDWLKR